MKFITSYLSILFFIIALSFGIGCDNASKQSDTKNEQGDTAAKTDDNNTSKRLSLIHISEPTRPY